MPYDNASLRPQSGQTALLDSPPEFAPLEHRELLRHVANAVFAINRLARHYKPLPQAAQRLYQTKDDILSLMLELEIPDIEPRWQEQPDGHYLLTVSIGRRRTPHCPFEELSWSAQCKVVQRIGPVPK